LILLLVFVAGCANTKTQPQATNLVWPDPPEQARLQYIGSASQPADLGFKTSGFSRFANWLIGTPKGNEKFVKPFGVALDEVGELCITDTGANVVSFFDSAHKRWHRWGKIGNTRFASPVAVAKQGEMLVVADSALPAVIGFDTKGNLLFEISRGLNRPVGVAIAENKLFVVDSQANAVSVFDLHGKFLSQFGERGLGPGQFNFPTHINVDSRGMLLVTDSMNGRVQMFDLAGACKGQIGSPGDSSGHFGRPKGAAADSFGHIYALDALFDNLQIFNREGQLLLPVGETGSRPGEFWMPNGIAITRDNRIYIADAYNRRIQIFKYVAPE
jgi:DNA-binding beta-propeller fold protein YncE